MTPYSDRLKTLAPLSEDADQPTAPFSCLGVLLDLIAEVLALPKDRLGPDRSFHELGINSLLAVRLVDRINRRFDLRLGVEVLFSYGDARRLSRHLDSQTLDSMPMAPQKTPEVPTAPPEAAVAVIGYAGRFAQADDPDALWSSLEHGVSMHSKMPDYRLSPDTQDPPTAGFLEDAERFENEFFGISPREAAAMDPVQRLFLEQSWCALEHAGLTRSKLVQQRVGVYAGASSSGYDRTVPVSGKAVDSYIMTGNLASMTAARVAYHLDLEGPAVTVDTACSSSLMAIHLASQALLNGEIDTAIAGGASLFIDERAFAAMQAAGMTSPTGPCKPFDERADGIMVGEGVGCVVLKRLSDALVEGDRIEAIIRASAANQDGRSNGITAPNARAQSELLQRVLDLQGINSDTVDLVETHGTGTRLGDPIEIAALRDVYDTVTRPPDRPLRISAVKACTGHTSEAAGVAGLIVALMALRKHRFPAIVGFGQTNSHIQMFRHAQLEFSATSTPWPEPLNHPRRAVVSSFGLSGTNVHLLLEEARIPVTFCDPAPLDEAAVLLRLSAETPEALASRKQRLREWLADQETLDLKALAQTLALHREPMKCRWATLARNVDELRDRLDELAEVSKEVRVQRWMDRLEADDLGDRPGAFVPLALPTYPFHGPRFWGGKLLKERLEAAQPPCDLGPAGTLRVIFKVDDPLVQDHRIAGETLLHAALLLDLGARAVAGGRAGVSLGHWTWVKPVSVHAATPIDVILDKDQLQIRVGDDIHVRAQVIDTPSTAPAGPVVDVETLWSELPMPSNESPPAPSPDDIFLGPSYPGPDRMRSNTREALAWLDQAPTHGGLIAPALLDAAIRCAAGLVACAEGPAISIRYPAKLEALHLLGRLPEHGFWIHALRRRDTSPRSLETLDIRVLDTQGALVMRLDGLALVRAPSEDVSVPAIERYRVAFVPEARQPQGSRWEEADLIVADRDDPLADLLARRYPKARRSEFEACDDERQACLKDLPPRARLWFISTTSRTSKTSGLLQWVTSLASSLLNSQPLLIRLITQGAFSVDLTRAPIQPQAAMLHGLLKTADCECPRWTLRLIDLAADHPLNEMTILRLVNEPGDTLGEPVLLGPTSRHVQRLLPMSEDSDAGSIAIHPHDHVILIGGNGRLGRKAALHFAQQYQARLTLIGRSSLDEDKRAFLEKLCAYGGEAQYLKADVGVFNQIAVALDQAFKTYGPGALLIQSAVDPVFMRLERTDKAEFESALVPKVTGLVNLLDALRSRPVGGLMVFSSIGGFQGFPGNEGQASYCASCTFEASQAQLAWTDLNIPTRVIHYGLWDSGDYPSDVLSRMRASGLYAMPLSTFGQTLERALKTRAFRVTEAQLSQTLWRRLGLESQGFDAGRAEATRAALATPSIAGVACESLDRSALDKLIDQELRRLFSVKGLTGRVGVNVLQATENLTAKDTLRALATAIVHMGLRRGLISGSPDAMTFPSSATVPSSARVAPTEPALRLLARCLDSLPELLSGSITGTDLLFPEGRMDWVEPIYRDQPILAACNQRLANAVAAAVEAGAQRIIEIGAGTGSTTAWVLDTLRQRGLEQRVSYLYTDLSRAFTRQGAARFGDRLAGARPLNINRSPAEQDIPIAHWDLVIATNVLHATPDIHQTLRHVHALLAAEGVLLLNEMVEPDDFATLTFGLLDDWWRIDDPEVRLTDGPILSIAGWQDALRHCGFEGGWAFDHKGHPGGSDGAQALLLATGSAAIPHAPVAAPVKSPAPEVLFSTSPRAASHVCDYDPDPEGVEARLLLLFADILAIDPEEMDRMRPFQELGVDSLVAPQIAEEIEARLGLRIRVTDIYKFGHLAALAAHLDQMPRTAGPNTINKNPPPSLNSTPSNSASPEPARSETQQPVMNPQTDEPIAIIGLSVRYPGAPDLAALWSLLLSGDNAIREVDRFDLGAVFDPNGGPNRTYAKWGGFLPEHDCFDPYFFNITPAEAEAMDPQQRVLMEETWKALEHAGIDPESIAGSQCGLFFGASANNYQAPEGSPGIRTLGGSMAILSARMAYHLNLHGPAFPIDTGCSSSLVAVHQACQSLRTRECHLALAGGVSVNLLSPDIFLYLSDCGMASRSGACRTFDADADGFVPGEGVGVLVLKRLSDALSDGDRIEAVLVGSGVNQDGRTAGLTAPSSDAQAALFIDIYRRYGLHPSQFGMIEAHGTGTRLGDPIEVQALTETFSYFEATSGACAIGSIKTQIGHTMAAAGVAGIAKLVLALKHQRIPPSLNFTRANPHIDFDASPFFVPTASVPWPDHTRRIGAVSSFGFSGTNAHVVLAEAPALNPPVADFEGPWLFCIAARDGGALKRRLQQLHAELVTAEASLPLARIAETLARGRAHGRYRRAFVAESHSQLLEQLAQALTAEAPKPIDKDFIPKAIGIDRRQPDALNTLQAAYEQGHLPDWFTLFGPRRPPVVLPAYPFARERFWAMTDLSDAVTRYAIDSDHPLLRAHTVGNLRILPGTLALELLRGTANSLTDIEWLRPLSASDVPARLCLEGTDDVALRIDAGPLLVKGTRQVRPIKRRLPDFPDQCIHLTGNELYARFAQAGFVYGDVLRVVDWVEISVDQGLARARLVPPETGLEDPRLRSAALLDGALQTAASLGHAHPGAVSDEQWVPARLDAFTVLRQPSGALWAHAQLVADPDPDVLVFRVDLVDDLGMPVAAFEGMKARRLPKSNPIQLELYAPAWQPAPRDVSRPLAPGLILVSGTDEALIQAFKAQCPKAEWRFLDEDHAPQALARLISTRPDPVLVLHLLKGHGMETGADGPTTLANLTSRLDPLPETRVARRLAQGLILSGRRGNTSLITLGCEDSDPLQQLTAETIAGLYRTLRLESPDIDARVVRMAPGVNPQSVALEMDRAVPEDPSVRYTGDLERWIQGWVQIALDDRPPSPVGGTVLLTGALGGIGRGLARWLAGQGPVNLALIGRSPPDAAALAFMTELESLGARVLHQSLDLSDARSLSAALARIRSAFGPIRQIYHLAGQLHDGFLRSKPDQDLYEAFKAKVHGTVLLDLLTRDDQVDSLVLFGSTAAVFGSIGQADYGAANAFMSAYAEYRQAQGLETRSIAWPLWSEGGMHPPEEVVDYLRSMGMAPLSLPVGINLLDRLLAQELPSSLVLHGEPGLADRLRNRVRPSRPDHAMPANEGSLKTTYDYLCQVIAKVTKLPKERIEAESPFEELGIDSIAIMKLNQAIEADLGPVGKTLFYEFRTPGDLAAHLATRLSEAFAAHRGEAAAAHSPGNPEDFVHSGPIPEPPPASGCAAIDAVAIIGVAGIYPDAENIEQFWINLREGHDAIREIPKERWPLEDFFDPDRERSDTSHCKWGGFINHADHFDSRFFGISPIEAETIDPQARKFMEVCWHALEDAGLDPERMFDTLLEPDRRRRRCGIFVGVMSGDYQLFGPEELAKGNLIGPNADYWNIANRVSTFLDFHGPSLAVDTACSSSLTALHLACQSLRSGESKLAIAGGVNLCLHPRRHWILSKAGMIASDGRCHSFGDGGDGYVPGEGIGAVVLKPLHQALVDGDRIQGVIRGSAINHGGRTSGYTVPSPMAQGEVILEALERSGVDPRTISYIEAHGTGTPLGDPIEIRGLALGLGHAMPKACAIGSVKSNIGHLESAAGIAGLTKVLLQMREATWVPTLHATPPNPALDLTGTGFHIVSERQPWLASRPFRAGLSSFGAGGANAHLIIESPPETSKGTSTGASKGQQVLLLSAPDAEALRRQAGQLATWLTRAAERGVTLQDVAHTLASGRKAFAFRLAVVGDEAQTLAAQLAAFADGQEDTAGVLFGEVLSRSTRAEGHDPQALAEAWILGAPPPSLAGHRIALPGYPFAQRRLWIHQKDAITVQPQPAPGGPTQVHYPRDHALFQDHRLAGVSLLPGAVSVALALQAAEGGLTAGRWIAPAIPTAEGLDLCIEAKNDGIKVRILNGETLFSAKSGPRRMPPSVASITELQRQSEDVIEGVRTYALLASVGAVYGPSLQLIERVYRSEGSVLGRLKPSLDQACLLDAAFQLCFALIPESLSGLALVPSEFESLGALDALDTLAWVIAQSRAVDASSLTADLHCLDAEGHPIVVLKGLVLRATQRFAAPAPTPSPVPLRVLRPDWITVDAPAGWIPDRAFVLSEHRNDPLALALTRAWQATPMGLGGDLPLGSADAVALVIGGHSSDPIAAANRLEALIAGVLETLRDLARRDTPPVLLLLTREAQDEGTDAAGAGLWAFIRAIVRERPDWQMVALDLPDALWLDPLAQDPLPPMIIGALRDPRAVTVMHPEWIWRDGLLKQRVLTPISLPKGSTYWQDGEVIVIAGSGGLGTLLARHVSTLAKVQVVLLGRRQTPNAASQETLDWLAQRGTVAVYLQADLSDRSGIERAAQRIQREFGPIAWLVHAAMHLDDAPLEGLTLSRIQAVLAPKTHGLAHLVTQIRPTRGLVVFSSSNALTANPGQAAYAAASAFIDTLALALPIPVHVLDWGFWGETGAVADPNHQAQLARIGVFSIQNEEGIDHLERVIGADLERALVLRVADEILEQLGVRMDRLARLSGERADSGPEVDALAAMAAFQVQSQGFEAPDTSVLDAYAARRLWVSLQELGVPLAPGADLNPPALSQALSATPQYGRLIEALCALLRRWDFIDAQGRSKGRMVSSNDVEMARRGLETDIPEVRPTMKLIEKCMRALGEVIAGRRDAVAVLFEDGQGDDVAEVYAGNPVLDHFHGLVAAAVRAAVCAHHTRDGALEVQILEVGAGTGATTGPVTRALEDLKGWSYRVTDLSAGLAKLTAKRLDPKQTRLQGGRLDVTRPLVEQGIAAGSVHLIVAANVLHATANLQSVLAHIKEALVPGGLLILNEATTHQDVNTLTFGLTPGWWAYHDGFRRIDHGPLLTPALWKHALREAGFQVGRCFGLPLREGGDHALQGVMLATPDRLVPVRTAHGDPKRTPRAKSVSTPADTTGLEQMLHQIITETLRLEPNELGFEDSFADHGADSILSVELVRRINAALNIDLKSTALFNYATVKDLANHLVAEHGLGPSDLQPNQLKDPGKGQAKRLIEVINRRRAAAPINLETEFWAREGDVPQAIPQSSTSLDRILDGLARGEMTVGEAMEYFDE